MSVKGKGKQIWKWVKDHKGVILTGLLIAGGAAVASYAAGELKMSKPEYPAQLPEADETDYGRDAVMEFRIEETGEKLGEVRCTESYARDMIEEG